MKALNQMLTRCVLARDIGTLLAHTDLKESVSLMRSTRQIRAFSPPRGLLKGSPNNCNNQYEGAIEQFVWYLCGLSPADSIAYG
ncbi:unnamed protein product [Danaus chrysippus]|uniref:(African queen) hypothetical protein n=1 Tax=Danaus chrysippus TaxID=151541 RepID=A0A8J2QXE7_9NEOP|nr:unnamed protein product [Danaus chrysippus]